MTGPEFLIPSILAERGHLRGVAEGAEPAKGEEAIRNLVVLLLATVGHHKTAIPIHNSSRQG